MIFLVGSMEEQTALNLAINFAGTARKMTTRENFNQIDEYLFRNSSNINLQQEDLANPSLNINNNLNPLPEL